MDFVEPKIVTQNLLNDDRCDQTNLSPSIKIHRFKNFGKKSEENGRVLMNSEGGSQEATKTIGISKQQFASENTNFNPFRTVKSPSNITENLRRNGFYNSTEPLHISEEKQKQISRNKQLHESNVNSRKPISAEQFNRIVQEVKESKRKEAATLQDLLSNKSEGKINYAIRSTLKEKNPNESNAKVYRPLSQGRNLNILNQRREVFNNEFYSWSIPSVENSRKDSHFRARLRVVHNALVAIPPANVLVTLPRVNIASKETEFIRQLHVKNDNCGYFEYRYTSELNATDVDKSVDLAQNNALYSFKRCSHQSGVGQEDQTLISEATNRSDGSSELGDNDGEPGKCQLHQNDSITGNRAQLAQIYREEEVQDRDKFLGENQNEVTEKNDVDKQSAEEICHVTINEKPSSVIDQTKEIMKENSSFSPTDIEQSSRKTAIRLKQSNDEDALGITNEAKIQNQRRPFQIAKVFNIVDIPSLSHKKTTCLNHPTLPNNIPVTSTSSNNIQLASNLAKLTQGNTIHPPSNCIQSIRRNADGMERESFSDVVDNVNEAFGDKKYTRLDMMDRWKDSNTEKPQQEFVQRLTETVRDRLSAVFERREPSRPRLSIGHVYRASLGLREELCGVLKEGLPPSGDAGTMSDSSECSGHDVTGDTNGREVSSDQPLTGRDFGRSEEDDEEEQAKGEDEEEEQTESENKKEQTEGEDNDQEQTEGEHEEERRIEDEDEEVDNEGRTRIREDNKDADGKMKSDLKLSEKEQDQLYVNDWEEETEESTELSERGEADIPATVAGGRNPINACSSSHINVREIFVPPGVTKEMRPEHKASPSQTEEHGTNSYLFIQNGNIHNANSKLLTEAQEEKEAQGNQGNLLSLEAIGEVFKKILTETINVPKDEKVSTDSAVMKSVDIGTQYSVNGVGAVGSGLADKISQTDFNKNKDQNYIHNQVDYRMTLPSPGMAIAAESSIGVRNANSLNRNKESDQQSAEYFIKNNEGADSLKCSSNEILPHQNQTDHVFYERLNDNQRGQQPLHHQERPEEPREQLVLTKSQTAASKNRYPEPRYQGEDEEDLQLRGINEIQHEKHRRSCNEEDNEFNDYNDATVDIASPSLIEESIVEGSSSISQGQLLTPSLDQISSCLQHSHADMATLELFIRSVMIQEPGLVDSGTEEQEFQVVLPTTEKEISNLMAVSLPKQLQMTHLENADSNKYSTVDQTSQKHPSTQCQGKPLHGGWRATGEEEVRQSVHLEDLQLFHQRKNEPGCSEVDDRDKDYRKRKGSAISRYSRKSVHDDISVVLATDSGEELGQVRAHEQDDSNSTTEVDSKVIFDDTISSVFYEDTTDVSVKSEEFVDRRTSITEWMSDDNFSVEKETDATNVIDEIKQLCNAPSDLSMESGEIHADDLHQDCGQVSTVKQITQRVLNVEERQTVPSFAPNLLFLQDNGNETREGITVFKAQEGLEKARSARHTSTTRLDVSVRAKVRATKEPKFAVNNFLLRSEKSHLQYDASDNRELSTGPVRPTKVSGTQELSATLKRETRNQSPTDAIKATSPDSFSLESREAIGYPLAELNLLPEDAIGHCKSLKHCDVGVTECSGEKDLHSQVSDVDFENNRFNNYQRANTKREKIKSVDVYERAELPQHTDVQSLPRPVSRNSFLRKLHTDDEPLPKLQLDPIITDSQSKNAVASVSHLTQNKKECNSYTRSIKTHRRSCVRDQFESSIATGVPRGDGELSPEERRRLFQSSAALLERLRPLTSQRGETKENTRENSQGSQD